MDPDPLIDLPARLTKLVCTIGPASRERVAELVDAGMDVARLNFSHGTAAEHADAADRARAAAAESGRTVALMGDLAGPKIRLGELRDGTLELRTGEGFALRPGRWPAIAPVGDTAGASVSYAGLADDVRPGDRVVLADGAVELRVTATGAEVATEVVRGGRIRSRAGVGVPGDRLSAPALTTKDLTDLEAAVGMGVDLLAQSFVRRAADVEALRQRLGSHGPGIVAKIETQGAIDDLDRILERVDAVMIARGDLGVDVPYEEVPLIQKEVIRRSLDAGVPTIVATQMLESMLTAPRPTRAEASDVANAVFDGTDGVMLSGETAIGAYPVEAARVAVRIIELCERRGALHMAPGSAIAAGSDAEIVARAAVAIARAEADALAIACLTRTGATARVLASLRPSVPILAFASDPSVVRRLALIRGVDPVIWDDAPGSPEGVDALARRLDRALAGEAGRSVVLVGSTGGPGAGPDVVRVHRIAG